MLLKNNKQFDQKGGKFSQKWLRLYTIMNNSGKGVSTLKNEVTLKNKYNIVQNKRFIQGTDDKSKSTSNEESINFWNHVPDEIVEMVLRYVVQQSENYFPGHMCGTYASIKLTCHKWASVIEEKGPVLLWKIYIDMWKPLGKPHNGKIIVSTRKLTSTFRKSAGLSSELSNCISDKKWKSFWLILTAGK